MNKKPTWNNTNSSAHQKSQQTFTLDYRNVTPANCFRLIKNLFSEKPITEYTFTPLAWAKINFYINLIGDLEITGLGKLEGNMITDIGILRQVVRSAYVSCDEIAIAEFMRDKAPEEAIKWNLDWHSHVDMGVTPSSTDKNNYEVMGSLRFGEIFPFMIINKSQDIYSANYYGNGHWRNIKIHKPIEAEMQNLNLKEIHDSCKKDITEKCKEEVKVWQTQTYYNNGYNGYQAPIRTKSYADSIYDNLADDSYHRPNKNINGMSDEEYKAYLEELADEEYSDEYQFVADSVDEDYGYNDYYNYTYGSKGY